MEHKLTLILIEDDINDCNNIADYANNTDDVELLGITNSSYQAITYVKEYLPTAIILDLELQNGAGNGITFLQDLKKLNLNYKPYILVTTNNTSACTYELAHTCGADFIMSKHQEDYSAATVIKFLQSIKEIIIKNSVSRIQEASSTGPMPAPAIAKVIQTELYNIGISPKLNGYKYLLRAIQLVISGTNDNLCVIIGQEFKKTASSVERAIQNAINKAWVTSDPEDLYRYYTAKISSAKGVPTLTEFIYFYANKLTAK